MSFLTMTYTYPYARPALTVDVALFHRIGGEEQLLLILRGAEPDRGKWALPGGYVDVGDGLLDKGEDLPDAAQRELMEETGLTPSDVKLRQVRAFGDPERDRRWRIVTVLFTGRCDAGAARRVQAGDDADDARWFSVGEVAQMDLAFDHGELWPVAYELVSSLAIEARD